MCKLTPTAIERFFAIEALANADRSLLDLLADDVTYDQRILQHLPVSQSLQGKDHVGEYLCESLPRSYQILEARGRRAFRVGASIVVFGGDRARIVPLDQTVETEWCAVFNIEADKIKKITLAVHRWAVLPCTPPAFLKAC